MNPPKKLTARQKFEQQQQSLSGQQTRSSLPLEFASVDEMLRHDALHTPVPPQVGHRLAKSLENEPAPPTSWWKRLFGKRKP